ncbi:MAG: YncE family protein [Phycisphaerales bacterium]
MQDLRTLQPTSVTDLPTEGFGTPQIAMAPDGTALYLVEESNAINLLEMVSQHRFEIVVALFAIAFFVLLLSVRHIRRTPHTPGEPCCRRCGHCLRGVDRDRCAECGADLRRRRPTRTGRHWSFRLAPVAAIFALFLGAGVYVRLNPAPPAPSTGEFAWWSTGLAEFALSSNIAWLTALVEPVVQIHTVDPDSGDRTRTLHTCRADGGPRDLRISVDGSFLLFLAGNQRIWTGVEKVSTEIKRIDVRTGRVVARFDAGAGQGRSAITLWSIIGIDPAGRRAWAEGWSGRASTALYELNLDDQGVRYLANSGEMFGRGRGRPGYSTELLVHPAPERPRMIQLPVIKAPALAGSRATGDLTIQVRSIDGDLGSDLEDIHAPPDAGPWLPKPRSLITADGRLFAIRYRSSVVNCVDLANPGQIRELRIPDFALGGGRPSTGLLAHAPDADQLFMLDRRSDSLGRADSSSSPMISGLMVLVTDSGVTDWTTRLMIPGSHLSVLTISVSDDGRRCAVLVQDWLTNQGRATERVYLYRLD